jgi:hypothetical protein
MGAVVMLVAVVLAIGLIAGVIGLVVAMLALAVKVAPLLLIGYVVVKLIQRSERRSVVLRPRGGEAWLDAR